MLARLTTIDPKLLAFSLLLAAVSLYLLIKAKTSPQTAHQRKESTTEAQVAKVLERKDELIKRALEVEKACALRDIRFLEELEEMKELAKRYEEEVLTTGEEEWKVGYKTRSKRRNSSSTPSSANSVTLSSLEPQSILESTLEPTREVTYDGLHYTLTERTGNTEQELEFIFTNSPPLNTKEKDKSRRRKPMTNALFAIRRIIDDHPDVAVKLLIGPNEGSVKEETRRTSDLVKGTDYSAALFRRMMPRKIPTSVSDMLGLEGPPKQAPDNTFFLTHLLTTIRPRNLTFTLPPIRDSPDRFLIPALGIPLIPAGAKTFQSRKQALEVLEVGHLIPVSRDCGSAYHFCFAEWRVKTLMVDCRDAASDMSPQDSEMMSFASVLFDPEYGFVRMMAGMQSDQEGQRESGTKIVLVVKSKTSIDEFRDQVKSLADQRGSRSKTRLDYAANPAHRLDLFKQKMFYLPKGKSKPRPIWSKSS